MDFELNKPDWYETHIVAPIEGFDQDEYGNTWFNVKFMGNAETIMWLAKEAPEENKKYYGHIEKTSSGKRLRFKRDKEPDDIHRPANAPKQDWKPKDERQITKNMVWKNLLGHYDVQSMEPDSEQWSHFWGMVELHTDKLLPGGQKATGQPQNTPRGNPALRKGLAKTGHAYGVADSEPNPEDLNEIFPD